ncbi:hypothetical protein SESBI_37238 [Sesbania bispinosa]|nr:hypothetical protein SESBI_37238 [Sesbania bispinosa]
MEAGNYFEWVEDELSAVDVSEVTKCVCFRSAESGVEAAKLKVGKLQKQTCKGEEEDDSVFVIVSCNVMGCNFSRWLSLCNQVSL